MKNLRLWNGEEMHPIEYVIKATAVAWAVYALMDLFIMKWVCDAVKKSKAVQRKYFDK